MSEFRYGPNLDVGLVEIEDLPNMSVNAGWVGGENVVLEQKEMAGNLVDAYDIKLQSIFSTLEAILIADAKPANWEDILDTVVISPVPDIDLGTVPAPGGVVLPDFSGIIFPSIGTLKEAPVVSINYTEPTVPADVDPDLTHSMSTYSSAMWLDLFTKVDTDILNGGTGLSAGVQAARHSLDADRKQDANDKAYLVAQQNLNSKALSFPAFVMTNLDNQMAAEVMRQEHASSNEIYIADGDLAQKNTQFAIDKGVELEKILRSFWQIQEQMNFDFKKGVSEFILKKFSENTQAYLVKYQAITAKMQANVAAAQAVISSNQSVIDVFKIMTVGVLGEAELISKERDSLVKVNQQEVDMYKTRVEAATMYYKALDDNQKTKLQAGFLELDKGKAELDFLLKNQLSLLDQRKTTSSELGKMFTQITSAALNTVSTAVHHSTSIGSNTSAQWSNSKALHESYNFGYGSSESRNVSQKGPDLST